MLEDKIQESSDELFWVSIGSHVIDQRSGDGLFIGRIEVLVIRFWKEFSKLWDAGREYRLCSEQDHPGIPISRRRSVSRNRKPRRRTGLSPSWSTTTLEWLALMMQYWILLIYSLSLFMTIIFRNSIQDGTKFYYPCQRFLPLISWKVCWNWEYVSPLNSKLYWNCIIWRFIRRYKCRIIKNWRPWWKGVWIRNFDCENLTPDVRNWNRCSGQESKGNEWRWRRKRYLLPVERERPVFARRPMQLPAWE